MALPKFFDRAYAAVGRAVAVSRESLESALASSVVTVRCGAECASNENARWTAELAINLLARLYPRVSIEAPSSVADDLRRIATSINPDIDIAEEGTESTVAVGIGSARRADNTVFVGSSGWVVRLGNDIVGASSAQNPIAAGFAAALACSEVFRRVFRRDSASDSEREVAVSLLDYSSGAGSDLELSRAAVGDVAMAGLGAVANGAIWGLSRLSSLDGTIALIDPETVELSNLQRYVLTSIETVGAEKTKLASDALQKTGISIAAVRSTLEGYADTLQDDVCIPTICVSVDNIAGRRSSQALLPRLVVNGWTSEGGLGASWHNFGGDDACLACLYQPDAPMPSQTDLVASALGLRPERAVQLWLSRTALTSSELKEASQKLTGKPDSLNAWRGKPVTELYTAVICGTANLDVTGLGRVEAVPLAHQSVLAGLMMAAELIKRTDPALVSRSQAAPLVAWDDVVEGIPSVWTRNRPAHPRCICRDRVYVSEYRRKWA